MNRGIIAYNQSKQVQARDICELLASIIDDELQEAECKIWHAHPVWFLEGNPIVGYDKLKDGVRLLFWSGQSFDEELLKNEGKFKAASFRYNFLSEIDLEEVKRWLQKARTLQWDYKNIVKRKGKLERLK